MTPEDCVGCSYEEIAKKYEELHPDEKIEPLNIDLIVWKHTVLNPMVKAMMEEESKNMGG